MGSVLLKTKLHIPKPILGLVRRPRLLAKLNEGLRLDRAFSLISAPAGYGKTTLVADWLDRVNQVQVWLSLDEHDNDPVRFISYIIAALQRVNKNIGLEAARLLSGSGMLSVKAVVVTLINEIVATMEPFILVLDDFHVIRHESVVQVVQALLDNHPPSMHLVMITREDPALSLPRLRVRNQMTEIRMNDLRFDLAETGDFLATSVSVKLKHEEVSALGARTEGWIAGLQLAALSINGQVAEQVGEFIKAFSGNHRYIIDYLMEEVVQSTDREIQVFLTRTAVVDRFNAELGNELTGQSNAKSIIAKLEQTNLFLIPLDNERQWYRYHHLFGEFLRTELARTELINLQHRAALWFAGNGMPEEGIKFALAAQVYDLASQLLKSQASRLFQRGEVITLLDWLSSLPLELVDMSGELASYKAWSLFLLGKSEEAVHCLTKAEKIPAENSDQLTEGRLLALRGWIANYHDDPRTKEIAQKAIERIGDQDPFFREIALLSLGHAQRKSDPMGESTATLYMAYHTAQVAGHIFTSLVALVDITMNLVIQGGRKESMELCDQAFRDYVDTQGKPLPMVELLYIPLGILHYEGNNLEQAREYLEKGIIASQRLGLNRILGGDAEQTLALVYWALGDTQTAMDLLKKAKANTDAKAFPLIKVRYDAFEALLLLKQGDLAEALAWVERSSLYPADSITSFKEIPYMVVARTLYEAAQYEQALKLLNDICQFDRERGRNGRLIYGQIVTSLVLKALGRREEAIHSMEEAVNFAAVEGYIRPFLSEGPEVRDLLFTVESKRPEFITPLLAYYTHPHEKAPTCPTLPGMIELLSERELEVLRLLAAGLSNEEIGNSLFISLGTVKWHVKNIFGKLEVKNRVQAVARAQQMGVLANQS
ncbi:LuxR C-terminal-related transcriptional regulator [Desulfosporosinus sp. BICA1-9]|uniref:LuxR C-terminal-related transcriptional regulator n=1 Tax=Desulfosporosinus sp. BICA1-9 TaxID=1531958 RepID=UPI00054B3010|nr:LuxR C-terminal-related transcriptional regulator [Desulfosporosinus sp. BICA1-9]KJS48363.1 MAG: hypothetical protein VR66_14475 [Peptococcaceae bacterium BRH_c23]KJS86842.1 MAG: hypothetical protein JL57_15220 [Desulfosporosinus sp. BICA1-9]